MSILETGWHEGVEWIRKWSLLMLNAFWNVDVYSKDYCERNSVVQTVEYVEVSAIFT